MARPEMLCGMAPIVIAVNVVPLEQLYHEYYAADGKDRAEYRPPDVERHKVIDCEPYAYRGKSRGDYGQVFTDDYQDIDYVYRGGYPGSIGLCAHVSGPLPLHA